jgi:uncharacterized protein
MTSTNFKTFITNFHPLTQLSFLIGICVVFSMFFSLISMPIVQALWDINVLEDYDSLRDYSNPNAVTASRFVMLFSHLGTFVIPSLLFALLIKEKPLNYFCFNRPFDSKQWLLVFPMVLLAIPIIGFTHGLNKMMELPAFLSELERIMQQLEETSEKMTHALLNTSEYHVLLANLVVIAVVPAIGEELIFRGVVQRLFIRWAKNIHLGIWLAAFLFSLMHMQFYGFLPRMLMGAFLGYLFVYSGSIFIPMLVHFLNNAFVVILHFIVGSPEKVDQLEQSTLSTEYEWLVAMVFVIPFTLIFRWFLRLRC